MTDPRIPPQPNGPAGNQPPGNLPPGNQPPGNLPPGTPSPAGGWDGSPVRDYRLSFTPRATSARARVSSVRAYSRARTTLLTLASLTLAIFTLVYLFSPTPETRLPEPVLGVWKTDAPLYATRRFELRTRILTFQIGNAPALVTRHAIARVEQARVADGTRFRVVYFENGEDTPELTFEFVFRNETRPEIVFVNQPDIVWTRVAVLAPLVPGF